MAIKENKTAKEKDKEKQEKKEQENKHTREFLSEVRELNSYFRKKRNLKTDYVEKPNREFKHVILTPAVSDEPESYIFRLLSFYDGTHNLIITNTDSKDTKLKPLSTTHQKEKLEDVSRKQIVEDEFKLELYHQISSVLELPTINKYSTEINEEIELIIEELIDLVLDVEENKNNNILTANEPIQKHLSNYEERIAKDFYNEQIETISQTLKGLSVEKNKPLTLKHGRILLGNLLNELGVVLRRDVHTIYLLDKDSNGYRLITHDDLKEFTSTLFQKNLVSDKDLKEALSVIDERLKPQYNIIRLKNGLYDMNKHEMIESEEPIFTLVEIPYNYNPLAESKHFVKFIRDSLEKGSIEETKLYIKGVYQIIGYLLTSGNFRNGLILITGIRGAGKTLLIKIITKLFGGEGKVTNAHLNELGKPHGTQILENSLLNISNDSSKDKLDEDSEAIIKQITGNDNVHINPKYRDPYDLPSEEVAKLINVSNDLTFFSKVDDAMISRAVLIEFLIMFRGTDKEDKGLLNKIIDNDEEMEYILYHSLKAYQEMEENDEDFILRLTDEETRKVIEKHSKPINNLLTDLILKYDEDAYNKDIDIYKKIAREDKKLSTDTDSPYIFYDNLSENIIKLGIIKGIQVPKTNNNQINRTTLLNAIKTEFDLFDYEDDNGQPYKTKTERLSVAYDKNKGTFTTKSKKVYPNLIKNMELWDLLDKVTLKELAKGDNHSNPNVTKLKDYVLRNDQIKQLNTE